MSKRRLPLTPERVAVLRASPVMHVIDAVQIYGFGRNRIYDFMREGRIAYVKLGGSTLLRVESLEALVRPLSRRRNDPTRRHRLLRRDLRGRDCLDLHVSSADGS